MFPEICRKSVSYGSRQPYLIDNNSVLVQHILPISSSCIQHTNRKQADWEANKISEDMYPKFFFFEKFMYPKFDSVENCTYSAAYAIALLVSLHHSAHRIGGNQEDRTSGDGYQGHRESRGRTPGCEEDLRRSAGDGARARVAENE